MHQDHVFVYEKTLFSYRRHSPRIGSKREVSYDPNIYGKSTFCRVCHGVSIVPWGIEKFTRYRRRRGVSFPSVANFYFLKGLPGFRSWTSTKSAFLITYCDPSLTAGSRPELIN